MKFTDGYWEMRPGMKPHYAVQVHEALIEENALTVFAPVGRLQERGHTVNQPLLTLRFTSPMQDVIRVQVVHHKGGRPRKPVFNIHTEAHQVYIKEDETAASLTSGDLSVRVHKRESWLVEFL